MTFNFSALVRNQKFFIYQKKRGRISKKYKHKVLHKVNRESQQLRQNKIMNKPCTKGSCANEVLQHTTNHHARSSFSGRHGKGHNLSLYQLSMPCRAVAKGVRRSVAAVVNILKNFDRRKNKFKNRNAAKLSLVQEKSIKNHA